MRRATDTLLPVYDLPKSSKTNPYKPITLTISDQFDFIADDYRTYAAGINLTVRSRDFSPDSGGLAALTTN